MHTFFENYFAQYHTVLDSFLKNATHRKALSEAINLLKETKSKKHAVFLIGNGGSMAMAEHMSVDLTKNAGLRAMALSGAPLLTAVSNDYSFSEVFQRAINNYAQTGDILIAISSSGSSMNILNGCCAARENRMKIITFSGFKDDNPLRRLGDINFWINSKAYGFVETIHSLLLHFINDALIHLSNTIDREKMSE